MPSEPTISVGLISGAAELRFALAGQFVIPERQRLQPGEYHLVVGSDGRTLRLLNVTDDSDSRIAAGKEIAFTPTDFDSSFFTLRGVTIGKEFHWQRQETQSFHGTLRIRIEENQPTPRLSAINDIPLESYLVSVISSEMSATSPMEFLKAHAVISRSWLLAQLLSRSSVARRPSSVAGSSTHNGQQTTGNRQIEIIRWTDRESHSDFDVCADDHCQRYQGITKAHSQTAYDAVTQTRGQALMFDDQIADARFSKCCGGMIEDYRSAWDDQDVPYLRGGRFDGAAIPPDASLPLSIEANAARWITSKPPAYCNTTDRSLLEQVLPDFDLETTNFFRWEVVLEQHEVQALLKTKLRLDLGPIVALEPVERGASGRIVRLRIVGERGSAIIGKELEIRRALSPSHLYSSAFIIQPEGRRPLQRLAHRGLETAPTPERFRLIGAGWGHGVGLCQIGAALMAAKGKRYQEVLSHYYDPCIVRTAYE